MAARRWAVLLAVVAVALAAGCGSAPVRAPGGMPPAAVSPEGRSSAPAAGQAVLDPVVAGLVGAARSVLGAPYRYGGDDRRGGFDCSGLISYAFAAAGVPLPRTAAEQAEAGRWVPLDELRAGDLVFFATAAKPNHVGLVVSADGAPLRMIHASSSQGVVETEVLRERYWLDRLRFARRVLPGG